MKYYRLSWEDVVWGISWKNINCLIASINKPDEKGEDKEIIIDSMNDLPSAIFG